MAVKFLTHGDLGQHNLITNNFSFIEKFSKGCVYYRVCFQF